MYKTWLMFTNNRKISIKHWISATTKNNVLSNFDFDGDTNDTIELEATPLTICNTYITSDCCASIHSHK